jgi:hypothetical protein
MWCTNCQQDVPAVANGDFARCAQCGRFLKRRIDEATTASNSFAAFNDTESNMETSFASAPDDDWMLQQQVTYLQRRIRLSDSADLRPAFQNQFSAAQTEPHAALSSFNRSAISANRGSSIIAWTIIALGLIAFLCGAALVAWAFATRRDDFWYVGLPLTLAGQFGLLFGLVLQLNRLGRTNRRITDTLENVDRRLHQMNTAELSPPAFTHPSRSLARRFSHS